MTNLTEARNTTKEIAQILEGLTPGQKLRVKDILSGVALISVETEVKKTKTS